MEKNPDIVKNTAAEKEKDMMENINHKSKYLSFSQEINVLSGIVFLITVPIIVFLAFSGKWETILFVYKIFVFSYFFWLFTSRSVYGSLVDKGQKKYSNIDLISRICAAFFLLFFVIIVYIAWPLIDHPEKDSFWNNLSMALYLLLGGLAIFVFAICQYIEVIFVMLEIRKKRNVGN